MARRFSSTDVDPEDNDPNAAVMESWQASIRRQAQLLMALAVSRKRNELLQRRKDGSVVQQVMAHEFAQLERASALQSNQHANALDGLNRWGRALETRLGVTVHVLSADLAELEESHRFLEHTLGEALRERGVELQKEQALSTRLIEQAKAMVALLSKQEAASQQLVVRAAAAEARAASLGGELEAKEESATGMGQRLADVVATQQAEHALQVDEMRREAAEAKAEAKAEAAKAAAEAEHTKEAAVLTATRAIRQETESVAVAAVQRQAEREVALLKRVARAEACVTHTAFVRNVAARVLSRLLGTLGVSPLDPLGERLPGMALTCSRRRSRWDRSCSGERRRSPRCTTRQTCAAASRTSLPPPSPCCPHVLGRGWRLPGSQETSVSSFSTCSLRSSQWYHARLVPLLA